MTLTSSNGRLIPLSQVGQVVVKEEDPILKRRDCSPTITVQSDHDESVQPPQVTAEVLKSIQPIIAKLPDGYRIEVGANAEESDKANAALAKVFPIMFVCTLVVIILQVKSLSALTMTILIGQIKTNKEDGLDDFHAVVEATVQRSRPVVLTALAAVLAFIPLTFSVFWGSLAYTLIGGTAVGTVLTLVFLPALYTIWFRVKPPVREQEPEAQPAY